MRTPTGYHIVRLNETRGASGQSVVEQMHARHILMKPNELQDDATVRQKLNAIRDRIVSQGEDFAGLAEGVVRGSDHRLRGRRPRLVQPGQLSLSSKRSIKASRTTRSPSPSARAIGWHIVQLLAAGQFDNTDELKRRRAAEAIRESRADEATELWMRRLRDEAYVEYKL